MDAVAQEVSHCPNPRCPVQQRLGRAAEYRTGFSTCSDCGERLAPGPSPRPEDLLAQATDFAELPAREVDLGLPASAPIRLRELPVGYVGPLLLGALALVGFASAAQRHERMEPAALVIHLLLSIAALAAAVRAFVRRPRRPRGLVQAFERGLLLSRGAHRRAVLWEEIRAADAFEGSLSVGRRAAGTKLVVVLSLADGTKLSVEGIGPAPFSLGPPEPFFALARELVARFAGP